MQQSNAQTRRVTVDGTNNILAAGTSDVNSGVIDTAGYRNAKCIVLMGTIAASGSVTCKLQHSDASGSGFADVASSASAVCADTDDNKTIVLEATDVTKRYLRVTTTRGDGGNSTIDGIVVELSGAREQAPSSDATNFSWIKIVGPVSGTA